MALRLSQSRTKVTPKMPLLKRLFWVYFLLLIFEGALRKWILPQLSAPLLLVRDPIALLIIGEAIRSHKWPRQWSAVTGVLSVALLGLCFVQLIAGDNPWFSALYGLRSYLLPFPVAFIMGENLDAEDLRKFGACTLWLLLPLVGLEVAQYLAPTSSWLNAGAGVDSGQLDSAAGHVRASATFSFATGPTGYFPVAGAFIFYGLAKKDFAQKGLLWVAAFALLLSIPVSGSRSVLALLLMLLACVATSALLGVSQFAGSLKAIVIFLIILVPLSFVPVFNDATTTLETRFSNAAGSEGTARESVITRNLDPITSSLEDAASSHNWLGKGIGYGSNVVSKLVTGKQGFLVGEDEFPRVINEFGPLFGVAFMLFRWSLGLMILTKSFLKVRDHEPLAWLLVPLTVIALEGCLMEQPTEQGFLVIGIAFSLAALKLGGIPAMPMLTRIPLTSFHDRKVN
jgi:hypothetical protein